jgi:fluoride exporter
MLQRKGLINERRYAHEPDRVIGFFATRRRVLHMTLATLWVFLGSALGGMARYFLSNAVARRIGETFPWGTLLVNVSGCLLIGALAAFIAQDGSIAGQLGALEFLAVGFCGGYTTFSSFSLQTLNLVRDGEWRRAGFNVVGSLLSCLAATWCGFEVAVILSETMT